MVRRLVSPTFVGRGDALVAAGEMLRRATAGRPSHLLVAGEAGIGKTRFCEAVADRAGAEGFHVLRGGCVRLGSGELPYAPIADALRALVRRLDRELLAAVLGDDRAILARITPALGPSEASEPGQPEVDLAGTATAEAARGRLFEALLGLLGRLSRDAPVLLVIEDLHWADSASLDTLAFILRSFSEERVALLLTFRSDELHHHHPLRAWLGEIERLETVARLELGPLSPTETAELIAAIRGDEPQPEFVERIQRRSDGNPFFVEELVAGEKIRAGHPDLPPTLQDVLLARVEGVPDDAQAILAVAAVVGREVDPDLLVQVSGLAPAALDAGIEACLDHHLLVVDRQEGRDRLEFRHALIQEVVDDGLLPDERIRIHRSVAEAITARIRSPGQQEPGQWAELVGHWEAAHDEVRALEAALRAAEEARHVYASAAALALYRRALLGWDLVPDPAVIAGFDRVELLSRAAMAAWLSGGEGQIPLLRQAVAEADRLGDAVRGSLLRGRLGVALWVTGDPMEASVVYSEAESLMPPGPPSVERAWILAGHGRILMLEGRLHESRRVCEAAIATAREVGDRRVEGHARNTLGCVLSELGRCDEAADNMEAALAIALEIADPDEIGRAYHNATEILAICGRDDRALQLVREGIERVAALGAEFAYGTIINFHAAVIEYELGNWDEAAAFLRAGQLDAEDPVTEAYILVRTVPLAVGRGDWDAAAAMLSRIQSLLGQFRTESGYTGPSAAAEAELAIWRARPVEALAGIEVGLARLEQTDDTRYRIRLLRLGTRAAADLGEIARDRRDASAEARALDSAATLRARTAPAVAAIAEMDGGLAAELAAEEATIAAEETRLHGSSDPDAWHKAAAGWEARGRPYHQAYVLFREAEASLGVGRRARAAEALARAVEIASRLGARPLLATVEALGRRARIHLEPGSEEPAVPEPRPGDVSAAIATDFYLTSRELEVLELMTQGLSNRRIAAALYISVHTAGIHVSRILGKLGAANRTEAASMAFRLGLVPR